MQYNKIKIINFSKTSSFTIYLLLSVTNLIVLWGQNPFTSFIVGQLIIALIVKDFRSSPYHFHIYQIINYYFYYSLVIAHSFNTLVLNQENYEIAYLINFTHFVFFSLGYLLLRYEYCPVRIIPRQNYIYLIYLVIGVVFSFVTIINMQKSYSDQFGSYESTRNLQIYQMGINQVISKYEQLLVYLMNNPFVYSIVKLVSSFIGYIGNGIKAGVLISGLTLILSYQFFVKKITAIQLLFLFFISIPILVALIGSTAFRGNLGLEGFLNIRLDRFIFWIINFLVSPESNHNVYTARIITYLDDGQTTFRYGFDYWRVFLYPIKHLFSDFELASYNQFPNIGREIKVNQGLYVGLAGELFWNFGIVFFVFSFFHGLILKKFTNWAFSGNLLRVIVYLFMLHSIIWHLYRGSGNSFMQDIMFLIIALIIFKFTMRIIMNIKYLSIRKYFIRFSRVS